MSESHRSPESVSYIPQEDVTDNDIICGRGKSPELLKHPGNIFYMNLIRNYKHHYQNNLKTKDEKRDQIRSIFREIQSKVPPGRFLKKCKDSNSGEYFFSPMARNQIEMKIGQALREKPKIYKPARKGRSDSPKNKARSASSPSSSPLSSSSSIVPFRNNDDDSGSSSRSRNIGIMSRGPQQEQHQKNVRSSKLNIQRRRGIEYDFLGEQEESFVSNDPSRSSSMTFFTANHAIHHHHDDASCCIESEEESFNSSSYVTGENGESSLSIGTHDSFDDEMLFLDEMRNQFLVRISSSSPSSKERSDDCINTAPIILDDFGRQCQIANSNDEEGNEIEILGDQEEKEQHEGDADGKNNSSSNIGVERVSAGGGTQTHEDEDIRKNDCFISMNEEEEQEDSCKNNTHQQKANNLFLPEEEEEEEEEQQQQQEAIDDLLLVQHYNDPLHYFEDIVSPDALDDDDVLRSLLPPSPFSRQNDEM